ncbi:MAG: thioredoxin family protein [Bacteroidota bacterium]
MKKLLFVFTCAVCMHTAFAQQEITTEASGTKIIKGFFTQKELSTDSAFIWYAQNQKGFTPRPDAVTAFKAMKDSINIIVFGGTWCGDTKQLLPQFFSLTDAAGFAQERITMLGVDRSKKTVHHLTEAFGITNVPTFIIMKNGKEIGRVVEYGKYGAVDRELGEIVLRK